MPKEKLDNPACKLEIEDIASIKNKDGAWFYCDADVTFRVDLLWIQGTISSVASDMEEIQLCKGGKTVVVINCKNIPGGCDWMTVGQYVMVFGEVQSIHSTKSTLTLRAIKISNLMHNPLFEVMWPHDVKEAKRIYAEMGSST